MSDEDEVTWDDEFFAGGDDEGGLRVVAMRPVTDEEEAEDSAFYAEVDSQVDLPRRLPGLLWDKFLVVRRDGTVPEWPYLVIGARDPAAPAALRAYAEEAKRLGMNEDYCEDVWRLADSFELYRDAHGDSDPDAGQHRPDDPETVARLKAGSTPNGWRLMERR